MKIKFYTIQLLLSALFFATSTFTYGQLIYSNTFMGASQCPTPGNIATVIPNVTGTPLTRSTITCTAFSNAFNSTTLNNKATINDNSYIEFSVTADAGYQLNVTSLTFFRQGSASAPNKLEIRYSTDDFATSTSWGAAPNTVTSPGATTTWDFDDFSTAIGGKVTFRIYPYGTQRADLSASTASAGASFRIDNMFLNGTATTTPMPVKLISFDGKFENEVILLNWETAWEEQNDGFEIQKSSDAIQFEKIGFVKGNATVKTKSAYTFTDAQAKSDKPVYYRLKQNDLDGSFEFSRTISIKRRNTDTQEISLYPNPSKGSFSVILKAPTAFHFQFFDPLGHEVPVKVSSNKGSDSFFISFSSDLTKGIYILKIIYDDSDIKPKSMNVLIE